MLRNRFGPLWIKLSKAFWTVGLSKLMRAGAAEVGAAGTGAAVISTGVVFVSKLLAKLPNALVVNVIVVGARKVIKIITSCYLLSTTLSSI